MSRMSEQYQDQQELDNESGMDLCELWHEEQMALPPHKREGYAERIFEAADDARKAAIENKSF
jgi:hypothetical protein